MEPRIWLIAGPTASGKSALALRLAEAVGGEIVGADSMQLYSDLRVLTARPSPEDEASAPHHLTGCADAAEAWSTGRWLRAAADVLRDIRARGRSAVVAGGTGLYFKALTEGLAEVPQIPASVREQAAGDYALMGESAFRGRLGLSDPQAAIRIAPGDRQRLVRAWEVFAATGVALTDWRTTGKPAVARGEWTAVALEPPRAALYARCDARLDAMIAQGALEEVRALLARKLDPDLPAMKAVGVRELAAAIAGETSLEAALEAAKRETRRYAKRQLTWQRGQMADWPRVTALDGEDQWRQFVALYPSLTRA